MRNNLIHLAVWAIVVGMLFGLGLAVVAHAQAQAAAYQVYVPLMRVAGTAAEPPPGGPSGALLLGDKSYRSAGIAVDRQGGMHAVFIRVAPFDRANEPAPVYYAYCAPANLAQCGQRGAWQLTPLEPDGYTHAQVEVTPAGRPRLLLIGLSADPGGGLTNGHLYRYGACDDQCGGVANWRFTTVLVSNSSGSLYETDYSYRNFALDHLGRPRFVYEDRADRSGAAQRGAWYVFCDANCTNHRPEAPTWFQTRIDSDQAPTYITERAVLAFTADGKPRVVAQDGGSFTDLESKLIYLECNAACAQSVNWQRSEPIVGTGNGTEVYGWSAAFDAQGRPRLAIYPRGGPFIYAWCDAACTTAGNWAGSALDFGQGSGASAALALDAQGRPRIAYRDGVANLGYAWCNADCTGEGAQWNKVLAEESNVILEELNVPILPTCVRGGWFSGMRLTLALDAAGNPRIGYDAEFRMECKRYPDDPSNPQTFIETKWWTSRFAFFLQP
jgi:hypothetical protein